MLTIFFNIFKNLGDIKVTTRSFLRNMQDLLKNNSLKNNLAGTYLL